METLAIGGAACMPVMATFNTVTHSSARPWVRSRDVALHTANALGSFAIGSPSGARSPASFALGAAALAMTAGILLSRWFPLRMGDAQEVTPVALWEEVFVEESPLPDDGAVSVEVAYRIRPGEAQEFLHALSQLRASRRRDGATLWRVYRDLGNPSRYVERFIVASWADYLHQVARATLADQQVEERIREFLREGEPVTTQHYIAER